MSVTLCARLAVLLLVALAGVSCGSSGQVSRDATDAWPSEGLASPDAPPDSNDEADASATPDSNAIDVPIPEKRCGESPEDRLDIFPLEEVEKFAECTVLVGRLQLDSVRDLTDLAFFRNVRRLEGVINVFRSPGFVTLHGLENLEEIVGHLYIHLNDNLTTIAALGKLRTVSGNVLINGNPMLPQSEVEAFATRVTVGGAIDVGP